MTKPDAAENPALEKTMTGKHKPVYVLHFHPKRLKQGHRDDLVDGFKRVAARLRHRGFSATAYDLWRASPWSNPKNQAAGSLGGTTAVANMTRDQRQARARKGGVMAMHGCEEGDGVRASARGRLLARRRWGSGRP